MKVFAVRRTWQVPALVPSKPDLGVRSDVGLPKVFRRRLKAFVRALNMDSNPGRPARTAVFGTGAAGPVSRTRSPWQ